MGDICADTRCRVVWVLIYSCGCDTWCWLLDRAHCAAGDNRAALHCESQHSAHQMVQTCKQCWTMIGVETQKRKHLPSLSHRIYQDTILLGQGVETKVVFIGNQWQPVLSQRYINWQDHCNGPIFRRRQPLNIVNPRSQVGDGPTHKHSLGLGENWPPPCSQLSSTVNCSWWRA